MKMPNSSCPLPLPAAAATIRTREDYNIIGSLKPGVPLARAQSEMDALTARLRRDHPDFYPPNSGLTFGIVPLLEQVVGDSRRPLLILAGAVACVLLIACANIANLLLARALGRSREMAIRAALGATRWRLTRQLLTESVALSVTGGLLGIALAAWTLQAIRVLGPASVPRLDAIVLDIPVLLFSLGISLAAGILFGLAPALRASRLDINTPLKGGGNLLRSVLAAAELALAVVLLIGAGLLVRSFCRHHQCSSGFQPAGRPHDGPHAYRPPLRQPADRPRHLPRTLGPPRPHARRHRGRSDQRAPIQRALVLGPHHHRRPRPTSG